MAYDKPRDIFGMYVFDRRAMRERLPRDVYDALIASIEGGQKLDASIADMVAAAMKEWALSKGATHYTHWFHPRTELTAEKHMAFLTADENGLPMESFKGKELVQSEPDASSFPSGGIRSTFEARGYSAWDPTSPAFIVTSRKGGTLCIPSVFISYDGTPLDLKTPLMKSLDAVESRALRLLKLFGNRGVRWAKVTVGAEQEFFLVDGAGARKRPDLQFCGRTIIGCQPPKGQQMEDHYFGAIPPRVLAYMEDVERDLYRLGVVITTRHNEVAPCQFEFAPQFAEANLACDQNQLIMETMRKMARRHDLMLLLHEKPFASLNGSGKHINFSIQDSEGKNVLKPSSNQRKNIQFLTFLSALLLGLSKYSPLLRASIASPGNMHRLGGNEAPPAIMSVYLGDTLSAILERIEQGLPESFPGKSLIDLGLTRLPEVSVDNTDRNRTAPLAFTGNKFEFRAPGASQSIAGPLTMILSIWAWGLDQICSMIESRLGGGDVVDAALEAIRYAAQESKNVRFEGNAYSQEWHDEAKRRGLTIANSTPEALALYLVPEHRQLLSDLHVMTDRETSAYYEIRLEQYVKTVEIEMGILHSMVWEGILPALTKQIVLEGQSLSSFEGKGAIDTQPWFKFVERLGSLKSGLLTSIERLDNLRQSIQEMPLEKQAQVLTEEGLPLYEAIRGMCDAAESITAASVWPYPTYRDLLYIP
ncbi:MAG: glutamine synthetase III [Aminobacterium sp.]|jgi:glutamine synthetase|uniref:glutamine synthetase III family protein n=1 Tax=unclassified Aminobacterium TaxID=2685012 RepID=UPI001BCEC89A|nr:MULTISPECIES: glutamine synthetase III [unclassified Aminobacterium]MDD2206165.1 glutamine synthetase III [Aminobacterium sp.]MDD3425460.1 glutamine synthetase III [Aminobacterium sp.]MDD3707064.1 glutamine synthetase III [Aminobacterium sp.]MDD4227991.1 glutamine synthetase III [Aminobacterium sp.]MDD4551162.1 glutamine synthetase III [Aminobacterium sp.]